MKSAKTLFLTSLLIFIFSTWIFTQEIQFSTVLENIQNTAVWQTTELTEALAEAEFQLASRKNDWSLDLSPLYRQQFRDDPGDGSTYLQTSFGVNIYTGLNDQQIEKQKAMMRAKSTATLNAQSAKRQLYVQLHHLYIELWLVQQEEQILEEETSLYEAAYNAKLQLYEGGAIALSEIEDAEEELRESEKSLVENRLAQRIAWYALQSTGTISADSTMPLKSYWLYISTVPEPKKVEGIVLESHSGLSAINNSILNLYDTKERLLKPDVDVLLKPGFSYNNHSGGLTYGFMNKLLAFDYTLPVWEDLQQQQSDLWTASVALSLEWSGAGYDRINAQFIDTQIRSISAIRIEQQQQLFMTLRTAYQKYLQTGEILEKSKRAYERANRVAEAVRVKRDAGQALSLDLRRAETTKIRSEYSISYAKAMHQKAYIEYQALIGNSIETLTEE